ncbi:hypothetical protein AXY_07410 [Amphibacillus xylanus NBRC 15112]|uniref:Uncharacterized protein n=1 Tax=Amphibacillus xylanus (strain ATCC 51415 / DSM 6626 / JCM 7361 / LMG 17667 / NBRC 15112 / Ep01) TaxID=698758 RepID=K0J6T9_AMPXN|nr:hypothetical protein AXY_07410 [Amphibacillus xylanus NBRC 15112]
MFNFHKLLMLSNKNKYASLIINLIVSTFITVSAIQSFIAEDTGLPTLFIIGVLQVLFLIQYLFIRLLYREELLVLNQDSLHLFIIGKRAKRKVFLNKIGQIVLIYLLQSILSLIFSLILSVTFVDFKLISIAIFTGFVLVLLVYLIDLDQVNEMIKSVPETFLQTSLLAIAIGLFYFPKIEILLASCILIIVVIAVKLHKVWRELT